MTMWGVLFCHPESASSWTQNLCFSAFALSKENRDPEPPSRPKTEAQNDTSGAITLHFAIASPICPPESLTLSS
jgi:hypothetical protein